MNPVRYSPDIVQQYEGLHLMFPEVCVGSQVLPLSSITRLPNSFHSVKFDRVVEKAYFGRLCPANGGLSPEGVTIINGFHRTLVSYMLVGSEGYITLSTENDLSFPEGVADETFQRLDQLIETEGLNEVLKEKIAKMDQLEEVDFVRDVILQPWKPWRIVSYMLDCQARDEVHQNIPGERKKVLSD
ncbi:hypothetical protein HOC01_04360 [archaeon]|jgi:hypothetical protein|nr:hypothetical protein [archaeon]MBT6698355.1 hypothetical protein [archaeon]